MSNFKNMIASALEAGQSLDEIMADIAAAANEIEQEKQAAEEKPDRDTVLNAIDRALWDNIKTGSLSNNDAAALVTLVVANDTETGKDMTADEIMNFLEYADFMISHLEHTWKLSRGIVDSLTSLFDIGEDPNKSKEKKEKVKNCGTDRKTCDCGGIEGLISAFKPNAEVKIHGPFDPADAEKIKGFLDSMLNK